MSEYFDTEHPEVQATEKQKERFNSPYLADDSIGDDWYDKFFSADLDRGFVKILDNVDSEGKALGQTALFRCPCQHAEALNLPINRPDERPSWEFSKDADGRMTLTPSIQQHELKSPDGKHINCNSHFFIRNGMVEWC